jgi:signal transduction histidine kinase
MITPGGIEVLVVDDSQVQADYIKRLLERYNYKAYSLNNAKEALIYLQANRPSLIITDVVMPEMSGFDLCSKVKSDPNTRHIPVILLTALSEPEDILKGLASGADNFITKPYDDKALIEMIGKCLSLKNIGKEAEDVGFEVVFGGNKYRINSSRLQILELLLSTYALAVDKNRELQRTIRQLRQTQQELLEAKDAAELANRYKSELLANISHEIRTPLNAIVGIADTILLSSNITEEQERSLEILKSSAFLLLALLNQLLDLSKVEAGRMELDNTEFDPTVLMGDVEALSKGCAMSKGLEFTVDIDASLPKVVFGDYKKIRQILINLISNAIKFTEMGFVRVNLTVSDLKDDGVTLIFSVSDSGIGIESSKRAHIFEPFVQADGSTTRRYGGTGLGLSICRGFAELMNGQLWVDSEVGKGSVFYFKVPLKTPKETKPLAETSITEARSGQVITGPSADTQGLTILVVDDNDLNLLIAQRMLIKKGHRVITAKNGREALEKLKDHKYDLLFMDVNMPDMDGLETTRMIRHYERDAGIGHTPVIAMTAYTQDEDRQRCLASGMDGYLSKPIDIKAIEQILARFARS